MQHRHTGTTLKYYTNDYMRRVIKTEHGKLHVGQNNETPTVRGGFNWERFTAKIHRIQQQQ